MTDYRAEGLRIRFALDQVDAIDEPERLRRLIHAICWGRVDSDGSPEPRTLEPHEIIEEELRDGATGKDGRPIDLGAT